jgi:hypothetical protein
VLLSKERWEIEQPIVVRGYTLKVNTFLLSLNQINFVLISREVLPINPLHWFPLMFYYSEHRPMKTISQYQHVQTMDH